MLSKFDTEGIWKIANGSLVYKYAQLETFTPTDLDVPFWFGPHYNFSNASEKNKAFIEENHILSIIEIMEIFGEPNSDVDTQFKGRSWLVARFKNATDAVYFYMKMA